MAYLANLTGYLQNWGFYDFVFPLLLFFAIIYGLLQKTAIFGDGKQTTPINLIISVVLSFFIVNYTPAGASMASFLTNTFGRSSMFLIALLAFMLIAGLVGFKFDDSGDEKKIMTYIVLGVAVIVLLVYLYSTYTPNFMTPELWAILIFLAILGGLGFWLYQSSGQNS